MFQYKPITKISKESFQSYSYVKATASVQWSSKKIPTFKVPKFKGDTLIDDHDIAYIDQAFYSAAMAQFLDSDECCNNSPTWGDAFVYRIGESVAESDILEFSATELEFEMNCAKVSNLR